MNILLINPPQYEPSYPSIAIPSLSAYLKKKGIKHVEAIDLNVESYDYFFTKNYLNKIAKYKPNKKSHSNYTDFKFEEIILNINKYKDILRGGNVEENNYYFAKNGIEEALQFISSMHYPTLLTYNNLTFHNALECWENILNVINDNTINMYIEFYEHILPSFPIHKYNLIGISLNCSTQLIPSLSLAKRLKKINPLVKICFGGSFVTHLEDALLKDHNYFQFGDYFILHEGETPLYKLCLFLSGRKAIEDVPNLIYKKKGQIIKGKKLSIENLEELPTPLFEGLPLNKYFSPHLILPLYTSRGCYWKKCTFCSHHYSYVKYMQRNIVNIVSDIENYISKYDCSHFFFIDECPKPNLLKQLSIKTKKLNIKWSCQLRFENELDAETCKVLYKGGCVNVLLGLESASNRVLRLMKKGTNIKIINKVISNLYGAGINIWLLFFIGFPGETLSEARKTLSFVHNNQDMLVSVYGGGFVLTKHSEVCNESQNYGISTSPYEHDFNLQVPFSSSSSLTNKEKSKLLNHFFENEGKTLTNIVLSDSHGLFLTYKQYRTLSSMRGYQEDSANS